MEVGLGAFLHSGAVVGPRLLRLGQQERKKRSSSKRTRGRSGARLAFRVCVSEARGEGGAPSDGEGMAFGCASTGLDEERKRGVGGVG